PGAGRLPAEPVAHRGVPKHPSRCLAVRGSLNPRRRQPRETQTMGTTPEKQVWPSLRARDARALIAFLVDAFGFEETVVYADGDVVHHAQLSWPEGGGVMLGSAKPASDGDRWPLEPGSFGAYVVTAGPDELFARATAAGAEVLMELYDTDYGS